MPFDESDMHQFNSVFGRNLLAELPNFAPPPVLVVTMDDIWTLFRHHLPKSIKTYFVHSMEQSILETELAKYSNIASIVGLGGGQAIDAAKYLAWRLNLPLFQFPTSLSVDAVFGHRSAVRQDGLVRYVGWAVPETVYLDLDLIKSAPRQLNTGGVGDVFCFFTGVMDWSYAHSKGMCENRWPYDKSLSAISLSKAQAVMNEIDEVRKLSDRGIELLADALKWGGCSYHSAGWNPRHIEGVEHYIFYALEAHTGKSFIHGQAVCFGVIVGALMHQQQSRQLLAAITSLGIDIRPKSMGLNWEQVRHVLNNLKKFVIKHQFPYGIAHDFEFNNGFHSKVVEFVETAYTS